MLGSNERWRKNNKIPDSWVSNVGLGLRSDYALWYPVVQPSETAAKQEKKGFYHYRTQQSHIAAPSLLIVLTGQ